MKIEIKNYRSCKGTEGDAFSCALHIDGKKAAEVSYEGTGGPYRWRWLDAASEKAWRAHVEAHPDIILGHGAGAVKADDDLVFGDILDDFEEQRFLRRRCKKQTLFRVPGDERGSWRTINAPYSPDVKAFVLGKYPTAEIANERLVG